MTTSDSPPSLSPGSLARLGGLLYLVTIALGLFRELYVKGRIVVSGDMAATAQKLRQLEGLWRIGIAAELFMVLCGVALAWVLYVLLKRADPQLALLMVFFGLTALAVEAACSLLLIQAIFPVSASYMQAVDGPLRDGLVGMALRGHEYGFSIALLMFGPFFLATGTLIRRSQLFPGVIGVLYQISGVGYLLHSFVLILVPAMASAVFTAVALPIFVGECTFCLWLPLKGVDEQQWKTLGTPQEAR